MGRPNPSDVTKFSCKNGDMGILTFPFHLTTSRTGNLTRLIHTPLYMVTILILTASLFVQLIQINYLCPLLIHVTQLLSASINSRAPPEEVVVLRK